MVEERTVENLGPESSKIDINSLDTRINQYLSIKDLTLTGVFSGGGFLTLIGGLNYDNYELAAIGGFTSIVGFIGTSIEYTKASMRMYIDNLPDKE